MFVSEQQFVALALYRLRPALKLSPTIRLVATGNRWSGPMKSKDVCDFSGPLHWFLVVTDWIVGPSLKVNRGLKGPDPLSDSVVRLYQLLWQLTNEIAYCLKASICYQTQSYDPISCYGNFGERTNEIAYLIWVPS